MKPMCVSARNTTGFDPSPLWPSGLFLRPQGPPSWGQAAYPRPSLVGWCLVCTRLRWERMQGPWPAAGLSSQTPCLSCFLLLLLPNVLAFFREKPEALRQDFSKEPPLGSSGNPSAWSQLVFRLSGNDPPPTAGHAVPHGHVMSHSASSFSAPL